MSNPIILPTAKRGIIQMDPALLVLYGQSKVGKTKILTDLEDCLIIDTEKGTHTYEALAITVSSLAELGAVLQEVKKPEHAGRYKYVAVDTLDNVVAWMEAAIAKSYQVKTIGDIPYGAGYGVIREKVLNFMKSLRTVAPRVILTGHRKKAIIGETSIEVQTTSLDLQGKLKNIVSAESDAIGYIFRKEGKLHVSFETSDELEVGSRCPHLSGKVFEFDWEKIYVDKKK